MASINKETRKEIASFLNKNFSFKDFLLSNAFKDFLSNMAKIVTENPKVTTNVVINNADFVAYTDGTNINMNLNRFMKLSKEELYLLSIGLECHELGHCLTTDFDQTIAVISNYKKPYNAAVAKHFTKLEWAEVCSLPCRATSAMFYMKIFKELSNIIEDYYIEAYMKSLYTGLCTQGLNFTNSLIREPAKLKKDSGKIKDFISAVWCYLFSTGNTCPKKYQRIKEICGTEKLLKSSAKERTMMTINLMKEYWSEIALTEEQEDKLEQMQQSSSDLDKMLDELEKQAQKSANQNGQNSSGSKSGKSEKSDSNDSDSSSDTGDSGEQKTKAEKSENSNSSDDANASEANGEESEETNGSGSGDSKSEDSKKSENSNSSDNADASETEDEESGSGSDSSEKENGEKSESSNSSDRTNNGSDNSSNEESTEQSASSISQNGNENRQSPCDMKALRKALEKLSKATESMGSHEDRTNSDLKNSEEEQASKRELSEEANSEQEEKSPEEIASEIATMMQEAITEVLNSTDDSEKLSEVLRNYDRQVVSEGSNLHKNVPWNFVKTSYESPFSYDATYKEISYVISALVKAVEKTTLKKQRGYKENNLYVGRRLNTNALIRGDGKAFTKNHAPTKKPDLAVSLVVDQSGSMSGTKIKKANLAAIAIEDLCLRLNIPLQIIYHSTNYHSVEVDIVENFYDSKEQRKKARTRLQDMPSRSCNRDGAVLEYAFNSIKRRTEPQKLVMLVSDGAPNHDGYSGIAAYNDLKSIVNDMKKKHIGFIAFGIDNESSDDLKTIYGEDYVDIKDLNTLPLKMSKALLKNF